MGQLQIQIQIDGVLSLIDSAVIVQLMEHGLETSNTGYFMRFKSCYITEGLYCIA